MDSRYEFVAVKIIFALRRPVPYIDAAYLMY